MVPLGRDPATRKPLFHRKPIHGPKMNARAYRDWYLDTLAAGEASKETVSQSELKELSDLELKAATFKEKLLTRAQTGAKVEPGPRCLS
jgi:hypothetical protein